MADRPSPRLELAADAAVVPDRTVLVATKLQSPRVRDGLIGRSQLFKRLSDGLGLRLTLVACPAGFGKTSLLTAWYQAEAPRRAMAWLSLDKDDNDPAVLWSYVLEALHRVCPELDGGVPLPLPSAPPVLELLLPHLVNSLAEMPAVTLILDDFHVLTDGRARQSITWLVEHAPPTFHLVLSTRKEPDLPLAAMRAHGEVLELRVDDLRFSADEADRFLNHHQRLALTPGEVDLLVERTAGWPTGLYLAALSLRHSHNRHELVTRFGASNRHVIDFLESEVMDAHNPADQQMMTRCSVLEQLSGPLCDAVLEHTGSAETLHRLSQDNLFLTPLDDLGGWYRFHPLFAQLLRVELERREPGLAADLHRRAYAWHRERGDTSAAIDHAIEAGLDTEAADLVAANWYSQMNVGRYETVLDWIRRFRADFVDDDVRLLLARAWTQSMSGKQAEAAHSIARAERLVGIHTGPLPDGFSSAEASLEMLKGVFPWGDVRGADAHARRALEMEGPDSPWYPVACWAVAMAHLWRGELAEADALFAEVIAIATLRGDHWLIACASLGYRSIIAGDVGRLDEQMRLAEDSAVLAREHGIENNTAGPSMALGKSLVAQGRPADAVPVLERGVALARFQAQPLVLVRTLRDLAKALVMLGRRERAAAVAAEVGSVLAGCVDPATLADPPAPAPRQAHERAALVGGPLTHRELTVLALLAGDLSEADIGRELFVSHSTVHSHVKAIYRKLGATSRTEALERARGAGLL